MLGCDREQLLPVGKHVDDDGYVRAGVQRQASRVLAGIDGAVDKCLETDALEDQIARIARAGFQCRAEFPRGRNLQAGIDGNLFHIEAGRIEHDRIPLDQQELVADFRLADFRARG